MRIPINGLWTNPNDFDAPNGSAEVLDNMTQDGPGIWEPRRGFGLLEGSPTITGPINQAVFFRGSLIVHHHLTSISRWTGTAWSTYSGTFTPPAHAPAGKVRFSVQAQSLFVTTTLGVMELDTPAGTWRLTGEPKALDGTATLRRTINETGFATSNGQWAYREEWARKNANGRLEIGPPSGRTLVQVPTDLTIPHASIAKANASTTVTITSFTHGFATGEYVDVTLGGAETWFNAGTFQVTRISATSFSYSDAKNNTSGSTQSPAADVVYGFTAGRNVTRVIPIPAGITTDDFVMIYRSAKSASSTSEPNDQLAQVYERAPTNLEIAAGSMTVVDLTPDDFRKALIDVSAETELAAKYRPPVCTDLESYHNVTWCPATLGLQTLELQIIAIGGAAGLQSGDLVFFTDNPSDVNANTWDVEFLASTAENLPAGTFKFYTDGSAAQNIANTAKSLVRAINGQTANTFISAEYLSGDAGAPGAIRVYGRTPLIGAFAALALPQTSVLYGTTWIPSLPNDIHITDIARSGSTVTVNTAIDHGLASGQRVFFFDSANTSHFPNGFKVVTVVDHDTFTYTEAGSTVTAEANSGGFLDGDPIDSSSDVIDRTDRAGFSLPNQPWAVPLPNERFIEGTPTTTSSAPTLFRALANRDNLFLLADAGIFRITGFYPDFAVTTLQTPLKLLAPETAVSMGTPGRVYGLFDSGALELLTSAETISIPVQDKFQALQALAPAALKNYGFAVAYPSEFKVFFFLPEAASDVKATNVWVFHTRTGDWARWDVDATCGAVDPVTDRLFLGQTDGSVWVERKTRTLTDYWDPGAGTVVSYTYSSAVGTTITISGATTAGFAAGDLIRDESGTATIVTSVASGTTLEVLSIDDFNSGGGTFTLERSGYTATMRQTRFFGGPKAGANVDKEVDSGLVLVQPPATVPEFSTMTLKFRNDYDPTFSTPETLTLDSVVTSQLPFQVPIAMQRSGWLQWELGSTIAGTKFRLLGMSLNLRASGVKSGF